MNKLFEYLLYLAVLCIPLYIFRFTIGPIPSTLLEALIYLVFLLAAFGGRLKKIKNPAAIFWGGLLVLAAALGALADPDKIRALGLWKAYFFDGYLLFAVVLSLGERKRQRALWCLVASGVLAAAAALSFYWFGGVASADGRLLDLDRLSPNYLAMYLAPIAAASAALWRRFRRSGIAAAALALAQGLILLALVLSGSRGGFLALVGAALFGLAVALRQTSLKKVARFVLPLLCVALLAGAWWFFRPDWSDNERKATSSNVRWHIWSTSLEMARLNPIKGVGLSNYQDYFTDLGADRVNYPEYISPQALTAHNLYLHLYLAGGILALLAFGALIFASRFWKSHSLPAALALAAILAHGLVDTPLFRNDLAALFWLVLALAYKKKELA